MPDKPSIAVLPFDNMSGDPEQEYFADGITEDLITDLSKISSLFVIASDSSFQFKGQNIDSKKIADELGVLWIEFFMEGIALNESLMQDDGIHPNAEAQPILLENAWPIIREALDDHVTDSPAAATGL